MDKEQVGRKACSKCKQIKPSGEFHKDDSKTSGLRSACRECQGAWERNRLRNKTPEQREHTATYLREWKRTNKDKLGQYVMDGRARNPEQAKAHRTVQKLVAKGALKRGECEVCGMQDSEAHHRDYGEPLNVKWLCRQHHMDLHREQREGATNGV